MMLFFSYFLFILNVETVLFLYISKFELCRWARRRSETNISAHNVCVCRHLWRLATPATWGRWSCRPWPSPSLTSPLLSGGHTRTSTQPGPESGNQASSPCFFLETWKRPQLTVCGSTSAPTFLIRKLSCVYPSRQPGRHAVHEIWSTRALRGMLVPYRGLWR